MRNTSIKLGRASNDKHCYCWLCNTKLMFNTVKRLSSLAPIANLLANAILFCDSDNKQYFIYCSTRFHAVQSSILNTDNFSITNQTSICWLIFIDVWTIPLVHNRYNSLVNFILIFIFVAVVLVFALVVTNEIDSWEISYRIRFRTDFTIRCTQKSLVSLKIITEPPFRPLVRNFK